MEFVEMYEEEEVEVKTQKTMNTSRIVTNYDLIPDMKAVKVKNMKKINIINKN